MAVSNWVIRGELNKGADLKMWAGHSEITGPKDSKRRYVCREEGRRQWVELQKHGHVSRGKPHPQSEQRQSSPARQEEAWTRGHLRGPAQDPLPPHGDRQPRHTTDENVNHCPVEGHVLTDTSNFSGSFLFALKGFFIYKYMRS